MPTLEDLGFELERRTIIFHKDTSMPDGSQLGYVGDPNNVIPSNSPGEALLFNCPSGTSYYDKTTSPYRKWEKVEDTPGGLWIMSGEGTTIVSGNSSLITFSGTLKYKNRYLLFNNQPSNIMGFPVMFSGTINAININIQEESTGTIIIQKNLVDFYTISMSSQKVKSLTSLSLPISQTDYLQVKSNSVDGFLYPIVQVYITW